MLDIMRRYSKSWFIKALLGFVALVFVSWGGYTYRTLHEASVAKVGDHYITDDEYGTVYSNMVETYRKQLGKAFSEDLLRSLNLKEQALESLINEYALLKSANGLGLSATPEEVRAKILELPVFQNGGKFDQARYEALLRQNRTTPETFERQMGDSITFTRIQQFVMGAASVSEEEVLAEHQYNDGRIKLAYVLIEPGQFQDQVVYDDNTLQTFYQGNQNRFMEPERRKISFVFFKEDDYAKQVSVPEEEARRYYEDFQSRYRKGEEIKARHILFSVEPDAAEANVEKAKAEAQKVLDEARKGKDFGELAKKYSNDKESAPKGGDLGYIDRKRMDPAITEAAFALKAGEISDLVRSTVGFHIIKVDEVSPERIQPFEEVKAGIETTLSQQKVQDLIQNKARDLRDLAYARKDIAKAAAAQSLELTGADVWIEQKPGQESADSLPPPVRAKLFTLSEGDVSDGIEAPKGIVIAQVKEIKAPQPIPFEQVKDRVIQEYRTDQAKVLARTKAVELLKLAREKNSLDGVAKDQKFGVKETGWFSRKEPDKEIRLLRGDELTKVFDLQEKDPFPASPFDLGGRVMVCQLQGKQPADPPDEKARSEASAQLLQQKQGTLWQAWVEDQRARVKVEKLKQL